ncbi:RagB/SusD family nutrient uptake outer membrane protein [Adhaeribacter aquaticus]|uniref:RagB/SusD family nutrient uptake outer membrane protein n=1 Tax=Adhaeribacter aquaticus TaxID=299567 RepID=UPI00047EF80A|nr:RagB/SusD family nutrient uptake outer membrane protein [Adhaeribacter aquaticus]
MKKKISVLLMAASLFTASCKDESLDIKNENAYNLDTYFKGQSQYNEAVIGTYAVFLHAGMYYREWYFLLDLIGNDAERDAPLLGDLAQYANFSYDRANTIHSVTWASLYRMGFRANLVLDKVGAWKTANANEENLKKQYLAEAHFLRGWAYFNLVNLWGRVPIRKSFEESNVSAAPRVAVAEGWKFVEDEFKAAIKDLPVTYASANRGRATQGAAIAMLGKSYLYQKKFDLAAQELVKLTTAPFSYDLNPSFDHQFSDQNQNSKETIFDIPHRYFPGSGYNYAVEGTNAKTTHTRRAQEYGFNDWRNVFISDAIVKNFKYQDETGQPYTDPRGKLTFYGDAASGGDPDYCNTCPNGPIAYNPNEKTQGYRFRKYEPYEFQEKTVQSQSPINSQVIRYADVLLMLAEAYIENNQVELARPLINRVRKRVNAFEYTTLGSQQNARMIVRRERQIELAGEQSRWFDLIRWGIAKQTINAEKQAKLGIQPFQDKHVLLPIPAAEINANPAVANDMTIPEWN